MIYDNFTFENLTVHAAQYCFIHFLQWLVHFPKLLPTFFLIQAYFAPKWNKTRLMISITLTLLVVYSAWGLCEGAVLHKSWWWRTFTGVVIQWGAGVLCWLIRGGAEFVFVPRPSYCPARKPHCWLTMLMLLTCHSPLISQYVYFFCLSLELSEWDHDDSHLKL